MARTALDPAILTEIAKGSLRVETMLKLDFPGGAITTTTSPKAISYSGDTYKPDARLAEMSGVSERIDGKAGLLALKLNPEPTLKARIAEDNWQRAKVYPFLAFLDADYAVLGTYPMGIWLMSTADQSIAQGEESISLECEPLIVDLAKHNPVWPSSQDQALRSPGDTFFKGVPTIKGQRFQWGGHVYVGSGGESTRGGGGGLVTPHGSRRIEPLIKLYRTQVI